MRQLSPRRIFGLQVPGWLGSSENLLIFFAGIALTGILASAVYDLATWAPGNKLWRAVLIGGALMFVWAITKFLSRRFRATTRPTLDADRKPSPYRALVAFVGAGVTSDETVREAINHHSEGSTLEQCWLIYTSHEKSTEHASAIRHYYAPSAVHFWPTLLQNPDDPRISHDIVKNIIDGIESISSDEPLSRNDLIVDITGGLRPAAIGAVLACIANDVAMQYVHSDRDGKGNPIPNTHASWKIEYHWHETFGAEA